MSGANALPEITLDELERLIRILGMLGSGFDPEVLVAAKQAQKWVVEHQTDWRALLTPPEEPGVLAVAAVAEPDEIEAAHEADRAQAFQNGFNAGMRQAAHTFQAQARAQAAMAAQVHVAAGASMGSAWVGAASGLGGLSGGFNANQPGQGSGAAAAPGPSPSPAKAYPQGTWQWVCQELLERDAQGIPGVFRGSREATFVADVLSRGFRSLTTAQEVWLRDIAGRSGLSW